MLTNLSTLHLCIKALRQTVLKSPRGRPMFFKAKEFKNGPTQYFKNLLAVTGINYQAVFYIILRRHCRKFQKIDSGRHLNKRRHWNLSLFLLALVK